MQHCVDHFNSSAWKLLEDDALKSAKDFVRSYSVSEQHREKDREIQLEDVGELFEDYAAEELQQDAYLNIGRRTENTRREIEGLQLQRLTSEELETVQNLYGTQNLFKCLEDSCFASEIGFDRKERLHAHIRDHHSLPDAEVQFPKAMKLTQKSFSNAASKGDVAAISAFLDYGLKVNGRVTRLNEYPLYLASRGGHFEACKLLLANGANVYSPYLRRQHRPKRKHQAEVWTDPTAYPPVDAAVYRGNHEIAPPLPASGSHFQAR